MKTLTLTQASRALAALAIAAGLTTAAPEVQAQTAARVESQTRPNFGLLLDPPASQSRLRRRGYGANRPHWRPPENGFVPPAYQTPGVEEVVLVDCGGNPGSGAIESAIARLRPGGSLILRSTAGACVGVLQIDKPLTVIGDAGLDPRNWDRDAAPTLQAPDGAPCVVVSAGVRVTFRDVVFAAPRAGHASCIVGYNAEIMLNRVSVRYIGDEPAIIADGGLLDLRDVEVDAETLSAAVVADRASVTADELWISKAVSGLEITAGDGPISRLNRVRLVGSSELNNFGPRPIGLSIIASRQQDLVEVTNSKICGYPDAVVLEGAKFRIDHSRICATLQAVTIQGGEALIENSRIVANSLGVEVVGGRATIRGNIFAGNGYPTDRRRGGVIEAENNIVWSAARQCGVGFSPIYGNRHVPVWNRGGGGGFQEPGFDCANGPYPREWWQQDEADLGVAYDPRFSLPASFDRFSAGRGWYDCRGRYVDSTRYLDDERWYRGSEGFDQECRRQPGYPTQGRRGYRPDFNFRAGIGVNVEIGGSFAVGW